MPRRKLLVAALAVTLVGACTGDSAGPDVQLSAADAAHLAPQYAELGAGTLDLIAFAAAFNTRGTGNGTFSRTSDCPAGGTVTVAGSSTRTVEEATKTSTTKMTATTTHSGCTFQKRDAAKVTINGAPHVVTEGTRKLVDGKPSGPQVTTQKGAIAIVSGDRTQSCTIDLTTTVDPTAGTHQVKGTYCGHAVDRTQTARRG